MRRPIQVSWEHFSVGNKGGGGFYVVEMNPHGSFFFI